jgi:hypothetical protein
VSGKAAMLLLGQQAPLHTEQERDRWESRTCMIELYTPDEIKEGIKNPLIWGKLASVLSRNIKKIANTSCSVTPNLHMHSTFSITSMNMDP